MYQDLEAVRDDLKQLERTLQSHDGMSRIEQAFEACARRVSDATATCSGVQDRAALQKIYRGMIAGRSIVRQLRELPGDGHSPFH